MSFGANKLGNTKKLFVIWDIAFDKVLWNSRYYDEYTYHGQPMCKQTALKSPIWQWETFDNSIYLRMIKQ